MNFLRAAMTVPLFTGGLFIAKQSPSLNTAAEIPMLNAVKPNPALTLVKSDKSESSSENSEESVAGRRLRIERVLMTLDSVASVALQMQPEQSSRIEPVLVDLAEQTLNLVDDEKIQKPSTDKELDRIEETLAGLMSSINKTVEPEAKL